MPPKVWAVYLQNVERHLAEVIVMQAQAATYGATATIKEARSGRQSWMSYLVRAAQPKEADISQIGTPAWKARLRRAGIAVVEVPK